MASSSNRSITSVINCSATYIRYKNRVCKRGVRAAVKISESTSNPGRLYYKCGNGECGFWAWCNPEGGTIADVRRDESNELVAFKGDIIDVMKEESIVIHRELKEFVYEALVKESRKSEAQVKGIICSSVV